MAKFRHVCSHTFISVTLSKTLRESRWLRRMADTSNTWRILVDMFLGKEQLEGGEGNVQMDVIM